MDPRSRSSLRRARLARPRPLTIKVVSLLPVDHERQTDPTRHPVPGQRPGSATEALTPLPARAPAIACAVSRRSATRAVSAVFAVHRLQQTRPSRKAPPVVQVHLVRHAGRGDGNPEPDDHRDDIGLVAREVNRRKSSTYRRAEFGAEVRNRGHAAVDAVPGRDCRGTPRRRARVESPRATTRSGRRSRPEPSPGPRWSAVRSAAGSVRRRTTGCRRCARAALRGSRRSIALRLGRAKSRMSLGSKIAATAAGRPAVPDVGDEPRPVRPARCRCRGRSGSSRSA